MQILVVDNHGASAEVLVRLLRLQGYSVIVAHTKLAALVAASRVRSLDVLLCDISLPDGMGCDVLRALKDRRDGAPRLAIALTGHGEQESEQECRRAGFTEFVVKPVVFSRVLALIANVTPGTAGEGAALAAPLPEMVASRGRRLSPTKVSPLLCQPPAFLAPARRARTRL